MKLALGTVQFGLDYAKDKGIDTLDTAVGYGNSEQVLGDVGVDFDKIGISRNQFMKKLAEQSVGSQAHYIPVVNHPDYKAMGYNTEQSSSVNKYHQNALSIPLCYGLTNSEQKNIVSSIGFMLNKCK